MKHDRNKYLEQLPAHLIKEYGEEKAGAIMRSAVIKRRKSAKRWYLYSIINMNRATVHLECEKTGENTILKLCISRLYFP